MAGESKQFQIRRAKMYFSPLICSLQPAKYVTMPAKVIIIYSYINTSGNWKNEKLCGNTTPEGRSVFTQFRVFPIFTSVDITIYYMAEINAAR